MGDRYILVDKVVAEESDLIKWAKWMQTGNRTLSMLQKGDVRVSTVFLGLDYSFGEDGPPVLWETMIFGGPEDGYQERFTSPEAAILGHHAACVVAFGE